MTAVSDETRRSAAAPVRLVILAPTFNHALAVGRVLERLDGHSLPIIVINDGATDATAAVLREWLDSSAGSGVRHVISHECNRGKAAALRSGFAEAARRGFTHAVTIDTDGQHDVADLVGLLEAAEGRPDALILGARLIATSAPPVASRLGRAISNQLVWLESGVRVTDSQSGMRIYPLARMRELEGRAARYGFETEVLTLAGWYGVPVIECPIKCIYQPPGVRVSHFGRWRDSLAAVGMHARLIGRALRAGPVMLDDGADEHPKGSIPRRLGLWFSPRRLLRMARGEGTARKRVAASFGVGLLMATLPIYGVKTLACLWLSGRFRLHPMVVLSTSSLSTPPLGFAFMTVSVIVGHLVLHGELPDLSGIEFDHTPTMSRLQALLLQWIVGSVIVGAGFGVLGYWLAKAALFRSRLADLPAQPATPPPPVQPGCVP